MKMQLLRITHVVLVVFTVFVPSNSGLSFARERGLAYIAEKFGEAKLNLVEVRGEEIAARIREYVSIPVLGITGEDLLENYVVQEEECWRVREVLRRELVVCMLGLSRQGAYVNAVFGLPALCILGRDGLPLELFKKVDNVLQDRELCCAHQPDFQGKSVVIPARYEALIRSRVQLDGAEVVLLEGQVDVTAARGGADAAIDIVLTGSTLQREGLGLFPPVLYRSDGIVIGNGEAQKLINSKYGGTT